MTAVQTAAQHSRHSTDKPAHSCSGVMSAAGSGTEQVEPCRRPNVSRQTAPSWQLMAQQQLCVRRCEQ